MTSVPGHFSKSRKQNKFQVRIVIATGVTVGLAEGIIDDACLVFQSYNSCHFFCRSFRLTLVWMAKFQSPKTRTILIGRFHSTLCLTFQPASPRLNWRTKESCHKDKDLPLRIFGPVLIDHFLITAR